MEKLTVYFKKKEVILTKFGRNGHKMSQLKAGKL